MLLVMLMALLFAPCTRAKGKVYGMAGPFRIIPGHIEQCPPELQPKVPVIMYYHGVRDRQNVNLWYYTGNFTLAFTFDDSHTGDVNMASWSSRGGWKDNAFLFTLPKICTSFRSGLPGLWRQFMVAIHDDPNAFCPFPPGTFIVRNVTTDFDIEMIPVFFYGKWRLTLRMLRSDTKETAACMRVFGETVPKMQQDVKT